MRVVSDTFGDPIFQKGLAILWDYERTGILCLALPARCKVRKLDFQSEFSMTKIIEDFLNFCLLKNTNLGAHYFFLNLKAFNKSFITSE